MSNHGSYWDKFTRSRVSRRRALQMAAVTGASAGALAFVGCSSDDDDNGAATPGNGTTPSGNGNGEGTPKPGGTLRGTVSLVLGKDPHKASTFLTHALASYSYSRLMRFKTVVGDLPESDWYSPEPEVASKVENPDELTYTFTLRDDVKFHNMPPVNGRLMNADDVVYSFERFMSVSPNKGNLAFVQSVTASADKKQVTFKLKEPFGLFLNRIASFQDLWIMPREFIEQSENASEERMLGSGPFMFDKFEPNAVIAWKKNPDYFEKDAAGNPLPYLDAVNLAIITDKNQELSQFAAGQLDVISVPPQLYEAFKDQSRDAIIDQAVRNILSFLYFEPASYTADKKPFNDPRVRRGMSMAIDREGLLQLVSAQGGEWPSTPINAGLGEAWWVDPQGSGLGDAAKYYKYDVNEAKAQFGAAGVPTIDTPMHFSTTVYSSVVPYYDIVRQALPDMLGNAGVSIRPVGEEYGVYIAKTFGRGEFEGFTFGLESVFSDIAAYWSNMFYPRDAGGGRNHSSVSDPQLVENIKKMLAQSDVEEIQKQNAELQKYASDMMYYVPVVTPAEFSARQPHVKGVLNRTGPTTYAVGTEGALRTWLDV